MSGFGAGSPPATTPTVAAEVPASSCHCTLTAPARPEFIDVIQDTIAELCATAALTVTDRMRFEGAVVEVANNVVEHAIVPPERAEVTILLTVSCDPERLVAVFEDDGQPAPDWCDPAAGPQEMPEWAAESGRGLAMVQLLTDDLRYERLAHGNRWYVACLRS